MKKATTILLFIMAAAAAGFSQNSGIYKKLVIKDSFQLNGVWYHSLAAVTPVDTLPLHNQIILKGVDSLLVHKAGTETIPGIKTFSQSPKTITPTALDSSDKIPNTAFISAALANYFTKTQSNASFVPLTRTITINSVTYHLDSNRSWTIAQIDTAAMHAEIAAKLSVEVDPKRVTAIDFIGNDSVHTLVVTMANGSTLSKSFFDRGNGGGGGSGIQRIYHGYGLDNTDDSTLFADTTAIASIDRVNNLDAMKEHNLTFNAPLLRSSNTISADTTTGSPHLATQNMVNIKPTIYNSDGKITDGSRTINGNLGIINFDSVYAFQINPNFGNSMTVAPDYFSIIAQNGSKYSTWYGNTTAGIGGNINVSNRGATTIRIDSSVHLSPLDSFYVDNIKRRSRTSDKILSYDTLTHTFGYTDNNSSTTPAALTKTDDTNVTLTLGGTPSTALLQATSLSLGWTGQLAISRGGTGQTTANAALNAFLPSQTGNSGKVLSTDGTNTSWINHPLTDTTNLWISGVKRSNDSVFYKKNNAWVFAYRDSVGSGGGGSQDLQSVTDNGNVTSNSVKVGNTNTTYGAFSVSRTLSFLNKHSFDDYSTLIPTSGYEGYGTFDASTELGGAIINNHLAAYQSRLKHSSTGKLDGTYGLVGLLVLNEHSGTDTITNAHGVYIADVNVSSSGKIINDYGLRIKNINQGINSWAIYSEGGASLFSGSMNLTGAFNHYLQKGGGWIWTGGGTNTTPAGGAFVNSSEDMNIFAGNNASTPQLIIDHSTNAATFAGTVNANIFIKTSGAADQYLMADGNVRTKWVPLVGSTTSSATPTINTDNYDIYKLTAQATNITSMSTNLTGSPHDGEILEIQITGTGTYTLAWGANFVSGSAALPTAITTTTIKSIFQFHTTSSYGNNKWTCESVL